MEKRKMSMKQKISPCLLVRRPGRGGSRVLHVDLSQLANRPHSENKHRHAGRERGRRHSRRVHDRWFVLPGFEWRTARQFNNAISLSVTCKDQAEVDRLWDALTADGGRPVQCGWLKDKFGVSWQIVPEALPRMMKDKDPAKPKRVMEAMMQMVKLDVQTLQHAYERAT
jgi:predicted 3-demethylubiquinone-9 3-methyltransferase (glyoxalase superfamily)